jgi:hypothetical protein
VQEHDGSPGVPPGMTAMHRDIAADGDVELVKPSNMQPSLAATRRRFGDGVLNQMAFPFAGLGEEWPCEETRVRATPPRSGGCSAGPLDQIDAASFRQSLQLAQAAISEADRRARQELPGRP